MGIWRQAAVAAALLATAPAAHAVKPYDFDGDGRQNLVASTSEGLVVVATGRRGLAPRGRFLEGDGRQLASGDFDGDGFADLATIVAEEARIYYGSERGLAAERAASWTEPDIEVSAVAAGDVDVDGFTDLAATTYGPDPRYLDSGPSGTVALVRGGPDGLERERSARLDIFSSLMRFADVDRDGVPDLVARSYDQEGISVCPGAGTAGLCYGFSYTGDPIKSLAIGDVMGDEGLEVIAGSPSYGGFGAVHVVEFGATGAAGVHTLDQKSRGVPGRERLGDVFGWSVEAGRVNRDRKADLVIGNPGERGGGAVTVLFGDRKKPGRRGGRLIHQGSRGVPGTPQPNDFFGAALSLLDHDADGRLDLTVGAPDERNPGESRPSGRVTLLPGSSRRPRAFGLAALGLEADAGVAFGRELGQR